MLSKPLAESSGGRSAPDIDLEIQQVADGICVFGPVQTMEDHRPRIDTSGRFAIDFRFQPVPEPLVLGQGRPRHIRRRHHARAELAHNFFPQLRVIAHRGEIQPLKRKIRCFRAIVMAGYAVLIEKRALLGAPTGGCSTLALRRALSYLGGGRRRSRGRSRRLRCSRLPIGENPSRYGETPDNKRSIFHRMILTGRC